MTIWTKRGYGITVGLFFLAISFLAVPVKAIELKAGTAKAVITPADYKGRITVMGVAAQGVEHDIYARVLVLDDGVKKLVFVTYDLNCLDVATPIVRSRALHELGIEPAYLILLATHNHAAPIQIVPTNFDYGRRLADQILGLIQEAIKNERGPVKIYFGAGHDDWLRTDPRYPGIYGWKGRPIDTEVQVLKVTAGDKTAAILFTQASHPLQASFKKIEVGTPGYAVDEVEKRVPGALAMYNDACGADQFSRKGLVMWASLRTVKKVAHHLADTVLQIANGQMQDVTGPLSSKLEVLSLPLAPPISYEEAKKLAAKIPKDIGMVPYPNPDRPTNWIRNLLMYYEQHIPFPTKTTDRTCTDDAFLVRELPEPREFPCVYEETIVAKIGPLVFVAMQGEVTSPIGKKIKDDFRGKTPLMVTAYMGEHNLYIPTRALIEKKAYEAAVIQIQYASPVGWALSAPDEMVAGVERMIEAVLP
jgi:hypothetical protein